MHIFQQTTTTRRINSNFGTNQRPFNFAECSNLTDEKIWYAVISFFSASFSCRRLHLEYVLPVCGEYINAKRLTFANNKHVCAVRRSVTVHQWQLATDCATTTRKIWRGNTIGVVKAARMKAEAMFYWRYFWEQHICISEFSASAGKFLTLSMDEIVHENLYDFRTY